MKIKKFNDYKINESNVDLRQAMSELTKKLHQNDIKYVYFVMSDRYGSNVEKFEIPEKYRKEFKEEYTGGDYGSFYKDTAEYIFMAADEYQASSVIFDFEIDDFKANLEKAINEDDPLEL